MPDGRRAHPRPVGGDGEQDHRPLQAGLHPHAAVPAVCPCLRRMGRAHPVHRLRRGAGRGPQAQRPAARQRCGHPRRHWPVRSHVQVGRPGAPGLGKLRLPHHGGGGDPVGHLQRPEQAPRLHGAGRRRDHGRGPLAGAALRQRAPGTHAGRYTQCLGGPARDGTGRPLGLSAAGQLRFLVVPEGRRAGRPHRARVERQRAQGRALHPPHRRGDEQSVHGFRRGRRLPVRRGLRRRGHSGHRLLRPGHRPMGAAIRRLG